MKLITCLVASTVAVVFAATSHAQVDCADWNTAAFFRVAGTSDITRCLEAGASPDLRDSSGFTPLHWAASLGRAEVVTARWNPLLLRWPAIPRSRLGGERDRAPEIFRPRKGPHFLHLDLGPVLAVRVEGHLVYGS